MGTVPHLLVCIPGAQLVKTLRPIRGPNGAGIATLFTWLSKSSRDYPPFVDSRVVRYPFDIPGATAVPQWVFINVTVCSPRTSAHNCS